MNNQFKAPPLPPRATNTNFAKPIATQQPIAQQPVSQELEPEVQAPLMDESDRPIALDERPTYQPEQPQLTQEAPVSAEQQDYSDNFAADLNLPASILRTKTMTIIMVCILLLGLILGAALFGGGSKKAEQPQGLTGIVANPDKTTRMPRCGTVEKGQACLLYIMNHTRYDRIAEDFFDEALKLTEVSKYSISMVNPKYAKRRIPPGYFAEIKIPSVR